MVELTTIYTIPLPVVFQPRIKHKQVLDLDMAPEAVNLADQQNPEEQMRMKIGKINGFIQRAEVEWDISCPISDVSYWTSHVEHDMSYSTSTPDKTRNFVIVLTFEA